MAEAAAEAVAAASEAVGAEVVGEVSERDESAVGQAFRMANRPGRFMTVRGDENGQASMRVLEASKGH